ncbi:MAG: metallophosphoesterase family protein [Minwuia sp.]|uniref:metallophosphoesterase family protein n=1 Tax=Minwuia sp. TaxID=2493630 RepID=UPI003A859374
MQQGVNGVLDLGAVDEPVLVYGGTYSNLQATQALLDAADRLGIPPVRRIHTGDIVAYCADAAAVSDLVMAQGGHVVLGNCEESFGAEAEGCGCGFEEGSACDLASRDWVAHANAGLTPAHRAFMAACPAEIRFRMAGRSFTAIHGGFSAVNRFVFETDTEAVAAELARTEADVVLAGHSGVPFAHAAGGRWWINAGVVGMPFNDGRTDTAFVVLSPSEKGVEVRFHRLDYDHAAAAAAMSAAGLPDGYRLALGSGFWPNMDVMPSAMQARRGAALALETFTIPAGMRHAA